MPSWASRACQLWSSSPEVIAAASAERALEVGDRLLGPARAGERRAGGAPGAGAPPDAAAAPAAERAREVGDRLLGPARAGQHRDELPPVGAPRVEDRLGVV